MIVVQGASVVTAAGMETADVAIEDGIVTAVGSLPGPERGTLVDGTGLVLGPGFVDLHVHLREPGETWKEDVDSGARAAAAGGFTAIVAMPNTEPAIDSAKVANLVFDSSRGAVVDVLVAGAMTKGRLGLEMADFDSLYEVGVRVFSDDGDSVADAGLLRRIMIYLSDLPGVVVAQHAEDKSIAAGGHLHDGLVGRKLGVKGLPASAEESVIARDLALVAETGVHYHVQHVSTRGTVDLVRAAKERGLRVSAEVTPHHLTLTDDATASLDPNTKMYPPLRSDEDVEVVRQALRDGVIDIVATDHAPHTEAEKDVPFEDAPRGVIGLETAFPLVLAALDGDVKTLFSRMSTTPAQLVGLKGQGRHVEIGAPANFVLVDPTETWRVSSFESKSSNSPFIGAELRGRVKATISGGNIVYRSPN